MDLFTKKIVKETNGIKMLLEGCLELFVIYLIFLILVRPDIVNVLNRYYEVCARDGVSPYNVWFMILPFIIVIGLLIGLLDFLILYSKNYNKKISKNK